MEHGYGKARRRFQKERKWIAVGNETGYEKQRIRGRNNAWRRVELLLDKGSWLEYGEFARSAEPRLKDRSQRDGVITGLGKIDGRRVAIIAHDITVLGATQSYVSVRKVERIIEIAVKNDIPVIALNEGGGVRLPDGVGVGFARLCGLDTIRSLSTLAHRDRRSLFIAAVFGYCYGDQALWTGYSDFTFMVKDSSVALSGPPVVEAAISEKKNDIELGGPHIHQMITGLVDVVVETEKECINGIKAVLSILRGPEDPSDPVDRMVAELESIVPPDSRKVYDMRKVLDLLSDNGEWIELKSRFGTGILIALSRIGGRPVAVIANQPQSAGGSVDAKGIRKCTAFLEFAVRRRLPVLVIQDHPGFLIGSAVERDGLIRAIANHAAVMETVDIPMVTLIIRKAYGAAYYFLGTAASGAQFVAGWPNAEISFMSPEIGASIFHKHTDAGTKQEAVKATIEELQREASIWDAASEFWVDAVIMPEETRKIVCRAFDFLC